MTATLGAAPGAEAAPVEIAPSRGFITRFRRNRVGMVGLVWIGIVVFVAIFAAPLRAVQSQRPRLSSSTTGRPRAHLLGTDSIGRDILSRIISSTPVELHVCALVMLLSVTAALPIGLIAGYFGGWRDAILMRIMDALFAFPPLMLALAMAVLLNPSLTTISIAIAIPFVPGFARLVRAQVLATREELYIEASRSVGVTDRRLLRPARAAERGLTADRAGGALLRVRDARRGGAELPGLRRAAAQRQLGGHAAGRLPAGSPAPRGR